MKHTKKVIKLSTNTQKRKEILMELFFIFLLILFDLYIAFPIIKHIDWIYVSYYEISSLERSTILYDCGFNLIDYFSSNPLKEFRVYFNLPVYLLKEQKIRVNPDFRYLRKFNISIPVQIKDLYLQKYTLIDFGSFSNFIIIDANILYFYFKTLLEFLIENKVVIYNLYVIITLFLNTFIMYFCLRKMKINKFLSFSLTLASNSGSYIIYHVVLSHTNLFTLWPITLFFYTSYSFIKHKTRKSLLFFGISFSMLFLTSLQLFVFALFILLIKTLPFFIKSSVTFFKNFFLSTKYINKKVKLKNITNKIIYGIVILCLLSLGFFLLTYPYSFWRFYSLLKNKSFIVYDEEIYFKSIVFYNELNYFFIKSNKSFSWALFYVVIIAVIFSIFNKRWFYSFFNIVLIIFPVRFKNFNFHLIIRHIPFLKYFRIMTRSIIFVPYVLIFDDTFLDFFHYISNYKSMYYLINFVIIFLTILYLMWSPFFTVHNYLLPLY